MLLLTVVVVVIVVVGSGAFELQHHVLCPGPDPLPRQQRILRRDRGIPPEHSQLNKHSQGKHHPTEHCIACDF